MRESELDLQFFAVPGPGGLGMLFERDRLDRGSGARGHVGRS